MSREFKASVTEPSGIVCNDSIIVGDLKSVDDNTTIKFKSLLLKADKEFIDHEFELSLPKDKVKEIEKHIDCWCCVEWFNTTVHVSNLCNTELDEDFEASITLSFGYDIDNMPILTMSTKIFVEDREDIDTIMTDEDGKRFYLCGMMQNIVVQAFDWADNCYTIVEDMEKAEEFRNLIFGEDEDK
mgnify:CR=1 FL=1